jgi:hypothetical protein
MKTALLVTTILYLVSFLYTAYLLAITVIVHFANKNLGHQDDYFGEVTNVVYAVLTLVFGFFVAIGWYVYRNPGVHAVFKWLVFIPLGLVLLYLIFAIGILVFGAGKWN